MTTADPFTVPSPEAAAPGEARPPVSPGRRIEYVALGSLLPNPRNPKAHDLTVIDSSVGRFGFVEPIVRDERTGQIISGHGRAETLAAMAARGETPPEGVRVDSEGRWQIPVVVGWSSRSDMEANAALIALNRTTEVGGWVDDALLSLLDDLAASDAEHGLDGVGYSGSEIEDLRAYLDARALTSGFDPDDPGRDDPDDVIADLPLLPGTSEVRVVYDEESRAALYGALADLPYVVNVRDVAPRRVVIVNESDSEEPLDPDAEDEEPLDIDLPGPLVTGASTP